MLADIWLASSDRVAVTEAVARFDHSLTWNPLQIGESRPSSIYRVSYDPPIGIEFEVIADDQRVIVQADFAVA